MHAAHLTLEMVLHYGTAELVTGNFFFLFQEALWLDVPVIQGCIFLGEFQIGQTNAKCALHMPYSHLLWTAVQLDVPYLRGVFR